MSVLGNSLSESIQLPHANLERSPSSAARGSSRKVSEKHKVIAASTGAVITSLTSAAFSPFPILSRFASFFRSSRRYPVTPFDVIKTRLQTQLPPESTSPHPPPVASTSTLSTPPASPHSTPIPSTSSTTATPSIKPTCCQKTYFNSTPSTLLHCKFDPRLSRSSLPAAGNHLFSPTIDKVTKLGKSSTFTSGSIALGRGGHVLSLAGFPPTTSSSTGGGRACLYPPQITASVTTVLLADSKSSQHLTGFWDAVRKIIRHEGIGAMWRGTGPALAMSVPGQVVYMLGYDWGRRTAYREAPGWAYYTFTPTSMSKSDRLIGSPIPNFESTLVPPIEERRLRPSYLTAIPLLAGSLSRTFVAVLVSPLELLRTQLQSSISPSTTALSLYRAFRETGGGWRSAWRGLPPTLWRDVPFSGIYWAGYEGIKRGLTGGRGMGESGDGEGVGREVVVAFVSGAGSGMVSSTVQLSLPCGCP